MWADALELARFVPILVAVRGRAASDNPIKAEVSGTPVVLAEVRRDSCRPSLGIDHRESSGLLN